MLPHKSECAAPPITPLSHAPGSPQHGCWHPKSFEKAIVVIVDALRYDFTVPYTPQELGQVPHHYHDSLPIFWDTAVSQPENAFLLPFIADPPTTTLQRLKGLTTGTLPTFIDAGSNFAGTAIDEDNLITQLHNAGKKIVQLGDDTWQSLFPGHFDPELTRPFDSFNVWDLHTVDNGVNEHIFPLLDKSNASKWDVIIGHYLGVDHAGHRYGPDHPAMAAKLQEMNQVFTRMIEALDDETLLVVMGDHGMDAKGDHGGESDDEVEAALWMYSKKGLFGRSDASEVEPPRTAKERPIGQIDLVPTLSLLLGMPIPFNNLGQPIKEAFIGSKGLDYKNLAEVGRLAAAQIHRYQGEYAALRKLDASITSSTAAFWDAGNMVWNVVTSNGKDHPKSWEGVFKHFSKYQHENLRVCRSLWARFDFASMTMGISVLVGSVALVAMLAAGFQGDRSELAQTLVTRGVLGTMAGTFAGIPLKVVSPVSLINTSVFLAGAIGVLAAVSAFASARSSLRVPLPKSFWGWICFIPPTLLCVGFASNSFTIWEDEILLYMLTTIGVLMAASSLRQPDSHDRFLGISNSITFVVLTRVSSFSRLCREEQMPYCKSTYYASATSSTSAGWQLSIPFLVALLLPSAIRDFYSRTSNYRGMSTLWLGIAFRTGLVLTAVYWLLDAADDGAWFPSLAPTTLKSARILVAQIVLAVAWAAGYGAYLWAVPFIGVETEEAAPAIPESEILDPSNPTSDIFTPIEPQKKNRSKLKIFGYANTHGTRYFILPTIWALVLLLLQKPVGQGTLALCLVSILNILEIVDANSIHDSPLAPVTLALLGNYYFFKTGHQAVLSSIQWETAFIPFKTVTYPWSPLLVVLSTFAPQILCVLAVPATVLWKVQPRKEGLLDAVAKALAVHILVYAGIALATVIEAAWLRRHLMLYRIFMPRMLLAVVVLVVVEVMGVVVGLGGLRWSLLSVGQVFGFGSLEPLAPEPTVDTGATPASTVDPTAETESEASSAGDVGARITEIEE